MQTRQNISGIWSPGGEAYFLSRPRRFGKSLLISTMEAYFKGKKELFHGLCIEVEENRRGKNAWMEYPVLTFSLSGGQYNDPEGLANTLDLFLSKFESEYGVSTEGRDLSTRFRSLIENLYYKTGQQVVVLVDEYDKPFLETMVTNPEQEERNRQLYKGFFSVLKDEDAYLKFVFFTGVTKFSKVSIFSDLNHLTDISFEYGMSGICGITEEELTASFGPEIAAMADAQEETQEECLTHLQNMYDGYHFSRKGVGVYNPYSLLNAFRKREYGSYWFETGTPTFLIRKLEQSSISVERLSHGVTAEEDLLGSYRAESKDPIPLFYQAGYLTITGYDSRFRLFSLNFPNSEVRYGFLNSLVPEILGYRDEENPLLLRNLILDLEDGNAQSFLLRLQSLFASVPYLEGHAAEYENYWRNQIFLILQLMGAYVGGEVMTAEGRCDCVAITAKYIYIFEFKLDHSAEDAMEQIESKEYALKYRTDGRKICKVGVSFSSKKRNLADWIIRME